MPKKTLLSIALIFLASGLFFSSQVYAQMGMIQQIEEENHDEQEAHGESIDVVLKDILNSQGIETIKEIDCGKIEDIQLERLGEASMSLMHPDSDEHERIDQMMGGEGSETLRSAHINMGSHYLGCSLGKGGGFMGMMNPGSGITGMGGVMGSNGNYSFSGFGGIFLFFWLTIWVLIIILLLVLIRYFWRKGGGKK